MSEERKLVSVLFADIVGSTPITVSRDAEVVRTTFRRAFDEARPIIEAHGGTVEKFIGDEIMAVFGVPAAHDDDADRAIRAAVAVRDSVHALGASPGSIRLELRIGINTGEAIAGTSEGEQFLVTGEPVIAAARIRTSAEPGEILVGHMTRALTKESVAFAQSRIVQTKGLGPLEVWPVRGLHSDVPEPHRGLAELRAPLVGRAGELRVLTEALRRVATDRAPMLVTVYGHAGAGKTRLVSEFTQSLDVDRVRFGRCLPYGAGVTFYPLQQILRTDAGIDVAASHDEAFALLRGAVEAAGIADGHERDSVLSRLSVVVGLADASSAMADIPENDVMEELRWGVRRYLERRATTPFVIVFEDVHWAEKALVGSVEHLAEWSRAPILFVCLARPEFKDSNPAFGASAANAVAITLSPLNNSDSELLVHELLRVEDLPESLRAAVVSRAEGNPLYVEEFLRMLIETGRVANRGGRWTAARDVGGFDIPPTIRGLITARLDRLLPELKRLLQSASIVGRLFSTSALAAIGGIVPDHDLLREAARRDLIVEADERAPGTGRVYRFRHALFREVAYSTVPKTDRIRLHGNYARWLEATLGDRVEEVAEILAYHEERAYLHAAELGISDANDLGGRALARLVGIADAARLRDDQHAAWGLYERAATVANGLGVDAAMRYHVSGNALIGRLTFADKDETMDRELEEAVVEGRSIAPSEVLAELMHRLAVRLYERGETERCQAITAELADLARVIADPDLLSTILVECGERAYWWGDRTLQEGFLLEALEAGRRGTKVESIRRPLSQLADRAQSYEGDFAKSAACDSESAALGPSASLLSRSRQQIGLSRRANGRGDYEAAVARGEEGLAIAREIGAPAWMIAFHELNIARALIELGDYKHARELLEHGGALVGNARQFIPEFRASAAIACIRSNDIESARVHVAVAKVALLSHDLDSETVLAMADAELAAATGDVEAGARILESAVARLEPTGERLNIADLLAALAELSLAAGRVEAARHQATRARDFFRDPLARGRHARLDALLERCKIASG
jgi:class 3 adenylate cyclase/tetratricopeptide (TPR) repeat protein